MLLYRLVNSPIGFLKVVVNDNKLVAILWGNESSERVKLDQMQEVNNNPLIREVEKQLIEYFNLRRTEFELPLEASGTSFQERVWKMLCAIPYGTTCSYKDIAERVNNPNAVRAVGTAIGRNPISIIIPCHRVIASNGSLAGFAGGLDTKKKLLDLELSDDLRMG